MNNNELISKVRGLLKQIMDDNLISDRLIYYTARPIAVTLIKREINLRKLSNSDNIFTPIECLNLIKTTYTECGIPCENIIRRSRERLPKLEEGIYNYIIQGVYNIDNSEEIFPTTIREQQNIANLRFKPFNKYYLIKDRYLYIFDKFIENVNMYVYISDNTLFLDDCESAYDAKFSIPGYLEDTLCQMIVAQLTAYMSKPKDITDDNLENLQ